VSVALNPALLPPGASLGRPDGPAPATGAPTPTTERAGASEGGRAPGPSFADVLKDATTQPRVGEASASTGPAGAPRTSGPQTDASGASGVDSLRFSKHALERVQRRGISLDRTTLGRLHEGVGRAAGKGSRDSIVLVDGTAFVVSVNNRTVITAVGPEHMREHVFTNIDSAVIA
jgi:flagellar operon protein